MKYKIWTQLHKAFVAIGLFAGTLAIANYETIWQEYHRADHVEINKFLIRKIVSEDPRPATAPTAKASADVHAVKPLQSGLSQSLEDDEILDVNPFARLTTLEPMQKLMQKGVTKFHRETFRSPDYQEESGYDLLSYVVEHPDGTSSTIMAYTEKVESKRAVFVVILVGSGEGASYSFFRGGELIEQAELTQSESQKLVAQRIAQGIPFLSVSR